MMNVACSNSLFVNLAIHGMIKRRTKIHASGKAHYGMMPEHLKYSDHHFKSAHTKNWNKQTITIGNTSISAFQHRKRPINWAMP